MQSNCHLITSIWIAVSIRQWCSRSLMEWMAARDEVKCERLKPFPMTIYSSWGSQFHITMVRYNSMEAYEIVVIPFHPKTIQNRVKSQFKIIMVKSTLIHVNLKLLPKNHSKWPIPISITNLTIISQTSHIPFSRSKISQKRCFSQPYTTSRVWHLKI